MCYNTKTQTFSPTKHTLTCLSSTVSGLLPLRKSRKGEPVFAFLTLRVIYVQCHLWTRPSTIQVFKLGLTKHNTLYIGLLKLNEISGDGTVKTSVNRLG